MKTQTEILDELGLLYDKNQLPRIDSSVEPNGGVLNVDKVLADNPECWDTITIGSSQLEKKTIILKWDLNENSENFYLKQRIVKKLIDDQFAVYFPTKDGLKKIEDAGQITDIPTEYMEMEPNLEAAQLKKLNLIPDRVVFLDSMMFNDLCRKVLSAPDAFFYFINFLLLDLQEHFSELDYSETLNREFISALEWSFDASSNLDRNWNKKYANFSLDLLDQGRQTKPFPQFLQAVLSSEQPATATDKIYFAYLLKNRPELLKKLTHITLANHRIPLFPFLNKREGLLSLAMKNCELDYEDENGGEGTEEPLLTTSLRFMHTQQVDFTAQRFSTLLNNSPNLISIDLNGGGIFGETPFQLQTKKTGNLKRINLDHFSIATEQLNSLLNSASNLNELNLENLYLRQDGYFRIKTPFIHLKKLSLDRMFSFEDICTLVNSAPNLETLRISSFNGTKHKEPLFQLENELKSLKEIMLVNGQAECVRENETISWKNILRNYRAIETPICPELFCIPITCGGLI